MPEIVYPQEEGDSIVVDLRDPFWAALLAWLLPGAGHFYQRRFAKGFLFMICVLSIYFIGLGMGQGRVVYASSRPNDFRWQYAGQIGAGAVALPALVQAYKTQDGGDPFFVLCERYPDDYRPESERFKRIPEDQLDAFKGATLKDGFMAPPAGPIYVNDPDVLGWWHYEYKHFFELGTMYTMIAGLLNLLAIYDAFCGPAILTPAQRERIESRRKRNRGDEF